MAWRKVKLTTISLKVEDRFWALVEKTDYCWEWKGYREDGRYGHFAVTPKDKQGAHRVAYQIKHGAIPKGMEVCHTCDNPGCVRPDHLFLGTHQDNMDDMKAKDRAKWQKKK